jgi:hypothetical protein
MLDLWRLIDQLGDPIGQQATNGELTSLSQRLSELGLEGGRLDGLAGQELSSLIREQGIDLAQIDAQTLATIAEQAGIELPFQGAPDTFADRPGAE